MLPGCCYLRTAQVSASRSHMGTSRKKPRLSGWLSGCLGEIASASEVELHRLSSATTTTAPVISEHLVLHSSQIEQDYPFGGGGTNFLLEEVGQSLRPIFSPISKGGGGTCRRNSVAHCASLPPPALPPLKKKKKYAFAFPTERFPVRTQHPASHPISILERDSRGERTEPAVATAMLQPLYYEQDIPKQLEGADIWCCALVVGPPQNGPVLSGNLVIFSASLARLQL